MLENAQQLAESIILAVAKELASDGFEFDISSSCFVKLEGDFRLQFQIALADRHGRLVCTPDVGVRSERIEDIFHRTSEFSDSDAINTSTLGVNVKLLTRSSDYDVSVSEAADVDEAVQKIVCAFREVAVPYFSEFGSLAGIDAALNGSPSERCVHMINERARCSKGLIVAKLLDRPNYEELRQIYDEKVSQAGAMTYEKYFVPLVNDLEHLGVS
ncbi:hypothetical protein K227x_54500 [Rubripirellula lacrimiformis]|jgi:hypothetical protein|uniref:Uncharacterized protein n=1 Tax=Rubripirellula lacrimiformis TaxID=1930273 RepID=A0A517NIR1_9BACT|nr:hypothetical protein [Rubripirellula lacrimiformis]QDT07025.1 hypothetical protein K227x_54500 [Rubripirellula lacrimiformis]